MSRKLVLQIANNQLAEAKETLHEELAAVVDAKLHEKKKMIAASSVNENRYKQQDRKNPKGLAEGKNPDRNLSDAGKEYNIHKLRVSASDEDPAMSGTLERIARAREIAMKKKALKEAKMSAKDAANIAVKMVTDRTKKNEKARLKRKAAGYPDRMTYTGGITPAGTDVTNKETYAQFLDRKKAHK